MCRSAKRGKIIKTAKLTISVRHIVREMDGKLRRIKKKTWTWKFILA
jgi:hypothetical protein